MHGTDKTVSAMDSKTADAQNSSAQVTDNAGIFATTTLLEALGINLKDPNFIDTPKRMWKCLKYLTGRDAETKIDEMIVRFPSKHNDLVTVTNIQVAGVCPHHILPVHYKINFAYIPNKWAIGISKIPRIIDRLARNTMLQEDLTQLIADKFESALEGDGIFVQVFGEHDCMRIRGAKAVGSVTSSAALRGLFLSNDSLRMETIQLFKQSTN